MKKQLLSSKSSGKNWSVSIFLLLSFFLGISHSAIAQNALLYKGGLKIPGTSQATDQLTTDQACTILENDQVSLKWQSDGNLVVYQGSKAVWATGTNGQAGARLVVQDDGNLVLYKGSTAVWDRHAGVLNSSSGGGTAPSTAKINDAISRAMGKVNTNYLGDTGCGAFVAYSFGVAGIGYNTALQFRNALANQGKIKTSSASNAPKGALVFSQSSYDGGAGHVVIALGNGTYISGGVSRSYGTGYNVQVLSSWNPSPGAQYLGWAYAPW